jgi:chemotaxis protein histidine kinase CheA
MANVSELNARLRQIVDEMKVSEFELSRTNGQILEMLLDTEDQLRERITQLEKENSKLKTEATRRAGPPEGDNNS